MRCNPYINIYTNDMYIKYRLKILQQNRSSMQGVLLHLLPGKLRDMLHWFVIIR